jgi:hypothetical protein
VESMETSPGLVIERGSGQPRQHSWGPMHIITTTILTQPFQLR